MKKRKRKPTIDDLVRLAFDAGMQVHIQLVPFKLELAPIEPVKPPQPKKKK